MEDIIMDNDDGDYQYESNDMRADLSTGRWTSEEHNLFLLGLKKYNKQWKSIAELVKTRTVVQIRTHAQKYFQKMDKVKDPKARMSSSYDSYQDDDVKSSSRSSSISNNSMESGVEGDSDSERYSNDNEEPFKRPRYAPVVVSPRSKRQVRACTLRGSSSSSMSTAAVVEVAPSPVVQMRAKRSHQRATRVHDDNEEDDDDNNEAHMMQTDDNDGCEDDDGDFFHFAEDEGEELDESIINLLDKIDWDATTTTMVTLPSRCPSPFMDSAASVSSSLESYGIAEVFPLLDFSTSAVSAVHVSPLTTSSSSSSSSSSVVHYAQQPATVTMTMPMSMPMMTMMMSFPPALQQPQQAQGGQPQERVAFAHVIQEIKQVFGGLQQRRQLEQQFEDEVGNSGSNHDGCHDACNQPPPLPSIRALIAMTSSQMKVSPATGRHGALTPSSNTFCHYPLNLAEPNFGFYPTQQQQAPFIAAPTVATTAFASDHHHQQQQQDGDVLSAAGNSAVVGTGSSRKRGRAPRFSDSY
jgi:SHAQKYF class myb-like DNA-binding protein